jgi:uncharacterized protein (TIGR00369 family)
MESLQKALEPLFPGLMGIRLVEVTQEKVVASLVVRPDLCTTHKSIHGGALMAFADTLGAIGTFVNLPKGAGTTTIESKTNFIGAAPEGTTLIGESTPFHRGRTTMVWQTQIRTDAGKLCAVVSQTQLVLPPKI